MENIVENIIEKYIEELMVDNEVTELEAQKMINYALNNEDIQQLIFQCIDNNIIEILGEEDLEIDEPANWISIKDRLPEDDYRYLITTDTGWVGLDYFDVRIKEWFEHQYRVVAWMPLPTKFA